MANNYYWRAVRRLAKRHDISVTKARRMDWEKEANAERKRRSTAHIQSTRVPVQAKPVISKRGGTTKKTSMPVRRVTTTRPVPSRGPASKLKIKEYERMRVKDEEEQEDEEDAADEWETDWREDWPELDDLDNIDDFLNDFEYDDSDKYREPS